MVFIPACALLISGCDFPDVAFTGGTSGGGNTGGVWDPGGVGGEGVTTAPASAVVSSTGQGGDGGEESAGAGGASRATSGSSGAEAASGAGAASGGGGLGGDGGAGGDGGSAGSGATASGTGGEGAAGGGGPVSCPFDVDRDGYVSAECEGGDDCDDNDARVHPRQSSKFYEDPRPGGGFDWDCSGKAEPEIEAIECTGLLGVCAAKTNVFLADVACGEAGPFGDCDAFCKSKIKQPSKIRTCH